MATILDKAQKMYEEGKWSEVVSLLGDMANFSEEEIIEAARIKGWCFYYMAIKGPEDRKQDMLDFSRGMFEYVLDKTADDGKKVSSLNGLPLAFWILNKHEQAWRISDQAVAEYPDEPSVWNTRSILCRWAKDFKQSIEVCEKVFEKAFAKKDYRTAGHGKQNKADALRAQGQIEIAKSEYIMAIGLYTVFEKITGESANFHIEGALNKLDALYNA